MLFVHDETGKHAYVMRGMSFGLDIVFVAPNGTVTEIHEAAPDSRARTPAMRAPVGTSSKRREGGASATVSGRVTGSSSRWTDRDKTVPRDETDLPFAGVDQAMTGLSRRIAWNLRHRWRRIFALLVIGIGVAAPAHHRALVVAAARLVLRAVRRVARPSHADEAGARRG